jgi:hypothetical protein
MSYNRLIEEEPKIPGYAGKGVGKNWLAKPHGAVEGGIYLQNLSLFLRPPLFFIIL